MSSFKETMQSIRANRLKGHLDLSKTNLDDKMAIELASALRHNTSVTSLDLSGCTFGIDGFTQLMESLKKNETLKKLIILNYTMTQQYLDLIANMLKDNKTIQSIQFDRNFESGNSSDPSRIRKFLVLSLIDSQLSNRVSEKKERETKLRSDITSQKYARKAASSLSVEQKQQIENKINQDAPHPPLSDLSASLRRLEAEFCSFNDSSAANRVPTPIPAAASHQGALDNIFIDSDEEDDHAMIELAIRESTVQQSAGQQNVGQQIVGQHNALQQILDLEDDNDDELAALQLAIRLSQGEAAEEASAQPVQQTTDEADDEAALQLAMRLSLGGN